MAALLDSRILQFVLLAICLLTVARRVYVIPDLGVDSWAPVMAATRFLQTGGADQLYQVLFFEQEVKFQYPPTSLLFFEPLHAVGMSVVAFNAAMFSSLVLNAMVIGAIAWRLSEDLASRNQRRTVFLGVVCVAFYFEPIRQGYVIGQLQIILNLLFSTACLLILRGGNRAAGVALAVAAAFKPQVAPILMMQMLQRQWSFVAWFIATATLLGLASLAVYGWESHRAYLEVLHVLSERGEAYHLNQSINGIANRLLGNGSAFGFVERQAIFQSELPPFHPLVANLTRASMLFFLALPLAIVALAPAKRDPLLAFLLGSVCFVLASPIAWTHHFGVLLPVYVILLSRILHSDAGRIRLGLAGVSFILVGGRFPDFRGADGWLTLLQAPMFFGTCILIGLLAYQVTRSGGRARDTASGAG